MEGWPVPELEVSTEKQQGEGLEWPDVKTVQCQHKNEYNGMRQKAWKQTQACHIISKLEHWSQVVQICIWTPPLTNWVIWAIYAAILCLSFPVGGWNNNMEMITIVPTLQGYCEK